MKTFDGKTSMNARVDVDYSKKQPKVKFSYPDRKNQIKGSMFWFIFMIIITITSYSLFGYCYYINPYSTLNKISYNNTFNNDSSIKVYDCLYSSYYKDGIINATNIQCEYRVDNWYFIRLLFLGIAITLGLTTLLSNLIYQPFKKKWKNYYPKFMSRGRKKITIFKPKDVKDNYVEIPYFKNIILDYKAEKDFAKYLYRVKIKEHNFRFYKGKKKKSKVNEWNWSARFYFKKKPRDGKLEVIFS